jgi:hypothetical protein
MPTRLADGLGPVSDLCKRLPASYAPPLGYFIFLRILVPPYPTFFNVGIRLHVNSIKIFTELTRLFHAGPSRAGANPDADKV